MNLKRKFLLMLVPAFLLACEKDKEQEIAEPGTPLTLSVEAEVSVDEDQLRSLVMELGKNKNQQIVPMPKLTDKQKVLVYTALKSTNGAFAIREIEWVYNAQTKSLKLERENPRNQFSVTNFNPNHNAQWFITGLIGGTRRAKRGPLGNTVQFEGTRILSPATNVGDAIEDLQVPYSFGWTPMVADIESSVDARGSHTIGYAKMKKGAIFKPHGALIAFKLGNNMNYGMNLETINLMSDSYGDQVIFNLNTKPVEGARPTYTLSSTGVRTMTYSFKNKNSELLPAHSSLTQTYYAWVIPVTENLPPVANSRVIFNGSPAQSGVTNHTGKYLTSYQPNPASRGQVAEGKVHNLTAKANTSIHLPIEYVTEYDVAGGHIMGRGSYTNPEVKPIPVLEVSESEQHVTPRWTSEALPVEQAYGEHELLLLKGKNGVPDVTVKLSAAYTYDLLPPTTPINDVNYEPRYTSGTDRLSQFRVEKIPVPIPCSMGNLRMSDQNPDGTPSDNPYKAKNIGVYNWYVCAGKQHPYYNPQGLDLAEGFNQTNGTDYRVPEQDDWWGVMPSIARDQVDAKKGTTVGGRHHQEDLTLIWDRPAATERLEVMKVGAGTSPTTALMQAYMSEYSQGYTTDDESVVYAIRFKSVGDQQRQVVTLPFVNPDNTTEDYQRAYFPAPDDKMKCAYRYRRVFRGRLGHFEYNGLIVDVVYLGENNSTTLAEISSPDWWSTQQTAGKVLSRAFVGTGGYAERDNTQDNFWDNKWWVGQRGILKTRSATGWEGIYTPTPAMTGTAQIAKSVWEDQSRSLRPADIYTDPFSLVLSAVERKEDVADYMSVTLARGGKLSDGEVGAWNANISGTGITVEAPDGLAYKSGVRLFKSNVF